MLRTNTYLTGLTCKFDLFISRELPVLRGSRWVHHFGSQLFRVCVNVFFSAVSSFCFTEPRSTTSVFLWLTSHVHVSWRAAPWRDQCAFIGSRLRSTRCFFPYGQWLWHDVKATTGLIFIWNSSGQGLSFCEYSWIHSAIWTSSTYLNVTHTILMLFDLIHHPTWYLTASRAEQFCCLSLQKGKVKVSLWCLKGT